MPYPGDEVSRPEERRRRREPVQSRQGPSYAARSREKPSNLRQL